MPSTTQTHKRGNLVSFLRELCDSGPDTCCLDSNRICFQPVLFGSMEIYLCAPTFYGSFDTTDLLLWLLIWKCLGHRRAMWEKVIVFEMLFGSPEWILLWLRINIEKYILLFIELLWVKLFCGPAPLNKAKVHGETVEELHWESCPFK